jgi:predicted acyltransferase
MLDTFGPRMWGWIIGIVESEVRSSTVIKQDRSVNPRNIAVAPNDPPSSKTPSSRWLSIDALRGFTMFWIIGGDEFVKALARSLGWPNPDFVETQLEHVEWEGFRFYDLIFPLFLFVVGVVIPFSLGKAREQCESRSTIYFRILRRSLLLFALGLLCNRILKLDFENMRIAGVLQRIAICYGIAAVLTVNFGVRSLAAIAVAILLGYWGLLAFVPAPGSMAGDYSIQGNLAGYVDRHYLPGKIMKEYYGYGDNEGILSTIPAVATALLGVLAGHWLKSGRPANVRLLGLFLGGMLCLLVGFIWGTRFPIIKNLWTSSFVLVAGGWSLLLLAFFHLVIDVIGCRRWAFFFVVIGANAITIYVVPRFIDFRKAADFFLGGLALRSGVYADLVQAGGTLVAKWLFLLYLYRKNIFLRL